MIKVSVIIPVYNAEKHINRCIDSILNQTFKDFELILVNDGSKDKSIEVLKKYKKNKNVKIFNQTNHGVAYTRNFGIMEAKGKYIMFIDNDDYIDNDYLETHFKCIEENNADLVISGYRRVNIDNKVLFKERLKKTYWSRYIIMAPWAKIYKRDFLIKNNIEFFSYGIGEDVYFNLDMYSYNPKICIIDYIGYNWFFNTKSVSNTSQRGLNKDVDITVLLNKIISKYDYINEYLSYYLVRYYIWYLLFSGRYATKYEFREEYNKIKKWFNKNSIKNKISPFSLKLRGEPFKRRIVVFIFRCLEKLHFINLFSCFYCKGKLNGGDLI